MHKRILLAAFIAAAVALPARASVTTTCTNESYTGNGATTAFSFPCKFLDNSHLVVTVAGVTKTLTTDYTVTGAGTSSGTVTFLTAPAAAAAVVIQRHTPPTQSATLTQRNIDPATIVAMADRLTLIAQELNDGALSQNSVALTGAVSAQSFNKRCMVDQYTGADLGAKLTAAIADSGCTSKVFDMSGLGTATQTISSNISLSISGARYIFPTSRINMGANVITVPVGVHSVTIEGGGSMGSTSNGNTTTATNFFYTGAAAAIVVGDSSAITYNFTGKNFAVNLAGAGANAIGIQLNVAIDYTLELVRVTAISTQWAVDLEGYGTYTGGTMLHPSLSVGSGDAVHFGKNANANTIVGAHLTGGNIAGSCYNFAGDVLGGASGNHIIGGDCENATNVFLVDYGSHNTSEGARAENCTNVMNASANSSLNSFRTKGTQSMTVVNAGSNNSATDQYFMQMNRGTWLMKNSLDTSSLITLQAGLTADQLIGIRFQGFGGTDWRLEKTSADVLNLTHQSTGIVRSQYQSSNTFLNSESAGGVLINNTVNSGTGGLTVYGGGGAPAQAFKAAGDGTLTITAKLFANLGTPAAGTINYCSDCTIANPCAGGGTGAIAKRLNGVWVCN